VLSHAVSNISSCLCLCVIPCRVLHLSHPCVFVSVASMTRSFAASCPCLLILPFFSSCFCAVVCLVCLTFALAFCLCDVRYLIFCHSSWTNESFQLLNLMWLVTSVVPLSVDFCLSLFVVLSTLSIYLSLGLFVFQPSSLPLLHADIYLRRELSCKRPSSSSNLLCREVVAAGHANPRPTTPSFHTRRFRVTCLLGAVKSL
jgi:hypothetical protein